ncbi:thiosulfate sulfurtransferase Tum1p [[Candida] jaroonii]|uniref:Thiosulfate sulfurtransferase Tum1p n=1 Tax=[Candida] jaroonii TaxID=467808 RepID=A0ACA9YB74_9ASCO|nr:thiosulfate sulfurtransferase Tum1p [[Candida] jaroonii]
MGKVKVINSHVFKQLVEKSIPSSRVIKLDATWYMPNNPKNAKQEFLNQARIPGSGYFDLDEICDPNSKYPHMLANYDILNSSLNGLGLNKSDKLVFYDKSGIFSSPRAAWNLILGGHEQVFLLDHYKDYVNEGNEVSKEPVDDFRPQAVTTNGYEMISGEAYSKNYAQQVIEYEELLELVSTGKLAEQYITFDARSNDRFSGAAPEPRPGLPSGHVPSSLNLPFTKVLNENGNFKSKSELVDLFKADYGLDLTKSVNGRKGIIVMCGTGVTAVILRVAIESILESPIPIKVYDGSWTEWAQRAPTELIVKD